ncbi:hypothetical protein BpHYR1_053423 [Brachionus plicatilis]|uniref:Uncharacterized protein n=1 Tax=Brachionus plicatilis TaxID=10195 RepID=A0A3M7QIK0_BRAPC|nr:hypothetical protein BpHYR1_053423 [Brachionus plicatilis]
MSSLEPRNEKDLIAVKAGINVKYPGLSEYRHKIGNVSSDSLVTSSQINHSIRDDLIQAHRLREQKFQDKASFESTGYSEYGKRYNKPIDTESYKRIPVTRKDFYNNNYFDNLPKYVEKSEYATSFSSAEPIAYSKTAEFTINPSQDVLSAGGGRPLARKIDQDPKIGISQTKHDHQWPKLEKRELFEWIK